MQKKIENVTVATLERERERERESCTLENKVLFKRPKKKDKFKKIGMLCLYDDTG